VGRVRVGILGGTFDPIHLGHLILAAEARNALDLALVLFIPAGDPWRKSERTITPPEHRLAMLELAIAGNDAFGISDIELRHAGPTYTADTLEALAAERLDDEFFFIAGSDALADMPNWHDPERIVKHATLAVAPRDVQEANAVVQNIPGIAAHIVTFAMPRIDISSTDVRSRVAAGHGIRYLVPDSVETYIRERRLYRA
jgi:nicotinate-nucleotide adenylyltransferase